MKIKLFALLALFLLAVPASASAQAMNIAIVDFQSALNTVEEGKRAKKSLEERMESARVGMEKEKAAIDQMRSELEAQAVMLSESAIRQKEAEYNQRAMAFQQSLVQQQQELALLEQELTGDLLLKLAAVAETYGKEKGFTLILEKTAVVYSGGGMDITAEVVARFNNK